MLGHKAQYHACAAATMATPKAPVPLTPGIGEDLVPALKVANKLGSPCNGLLGKMVAMQRWGGSGWWLAETGQEWADDAYKLRRTEETKQELCQRQLGQVTAATTTLMTVDPPPHCRTAVECLPNAGHWGDPQCIGSSLHPKDHLTNIILKAADKIHAIRASVESSSSVLFEDRSSCKSWPIQGI